MKHNPDGTLAHVQVQGGPCDGKEVPYPPYPGEIHSIGMPSIVEPSWTGVPTRMWCFYIWSPGTERYMYVDQRECSGPKEAEAMAMDITGAFK